MTCANNCKGVDPNGVVIGGTAVLAAAALTGQQMLVVSAGVAAIGGQSVVAAGIANGISQMFNRGCPRTRPCQVGCYLSVSTLSDPFFLPETESKEPQSHNLLQTHWAAQRQRTPVSKAMLRSVRDWGI